MVFFLVFPHFPVALKAFAAYVTEPQSYPTFSNFLYFYSHNW
jgi:hypothetical protein